QLYPFPPAIIPSFSGNERSRGGNAICRDDGRWGMLKNTVYNDVPTTQENMRERILNACASINSEMIERVRVSFAHRIRKCIEVGGHHFEHLLK
ncbi:hypothetical protein X777_11447, partial [Ooceraea biroi]